jgi:hypothetical protein
VYVQAYMNACVHSYENTILLPYMMPCARMGIGACVCAHVQACLCPIMRTLLRMRVLACVIVIS